MQPNHKNNSISELRRRGRRIRHTDHFRQFQFIALIYSMLIIFDHLELWIRRNLPFTLNFELMENSFWHLFFFPFPATLALFMFVPYLFVVSDVDEIHAIPFAMKQNKTTFWLLLWGAKINNFSFTTKFTSKSKSTKPFPMFNKFPFNFSIELILLNEWCLFFPTVSVDSTKSKNQTFLIHFTTKAN